VARGTSVNEFFADCYELAVSLFFRFFFRLALFTFFDHGSERLGSDPPPSHNVLKFFHWR